jgi:PKD repeat protein
MHPSAPSPAPPATTSPIRPRRSLSGWALLGLALALAPLLLSSPAQASATTAPASGTPAAPSLTPISSTLLSIPSLRLDLGAPWSAQAPVSGVLVFPGKDPSGQARLVQEITTPGSPEFGHFLQGGQFAQAFAPDPSVQSALLSYLEGHGLTVDQASPFFWNVEGPAGAMGSAFGTVFVTARSGGSSGYAPAGPLELPAPFAPLVTAHAGFQSVVSEYSTDSLLLDESGTHAQDTPSTAQSGASPKGTITLNVTGPPQILYRTGVSDDKPATLLNETYNLSISGGTGPYTVNWNWGDGTVENFVVGSGPATAFHQYPTPCTVPDMARNGTCNPNLIMTVTVNDSFGDRGTFTMDMYPGGSPQSLYAFYDVDVLHALGYSGTGTKIGLGELCDPSYTQAMYTSEADQFSAFFGLPNPTIDFIGSGASSCSGGSDGWAGETMLDLEWSHALAPNATIVIDLADSSPDEGDATWTTLSNGVFIASNSWTGGYTASTWATAAAQGESFLASSGDCAAFSGAGPTPASDIHGAGVGGTEIFPYPSGTYRLETAWNGTTVAGCSNEEGSTGGYDTSQAPPWFQVGTPGFSNANRGVPDISAIGGSWVSLFTDRWHLSAGTSLASPSYAAMLDLMYQYNGTATTTNGLIDYDEYALAKGTSYDIGVHDVTVGNNIANGFGYYCTPGWDAVTGLGAPNAGELAQLLAQMNGNPNAVSALTAILHLNITFGVPGLAVDYGVNAVGGPSNLSGYAYEWSFGDGTTLWTHIPHADHVYVAAGLYPATVTVFDDGTLGAFSGVSNVVQVHVVGALPRGGGPLSTSATATPAATDLGLATSLSSGVTGGWPAYATNWNYGDGTFGTGTGSPVSHTYSAVGTYTATVFVNDSRGAFASSSTTVTINPDPTVVVSANRTTLLAGGHVSFNATTTGGTPAFRYVWRFDDGAVSNKANPSVAFASPGTYVVVAWANDSVGSPTTGTVTITVQAVPGPLTATATASSVYGPAPLTVTFNGTATGGRPAYSFSWNFGDGSPTSSQRNPAHTFATAGTYDVVLSVVDQIPSTSTSQVNVTVIPGLSVSITSGPSGLLVGTAGTFVANATGGLPPYVSYTWNFGDGSTPLVTSTDVGDHAYSTGGNFEVNVTAKDTVGDLATSANFPVMVTSPTSVSLLSVAVAPSGAQLAPGARQEFEGIPSCSGTCPSSGLTLTWSLNSSLATLASDSGAWTNLTAGPKLGIVDLELTALLDGVSRSANVSVSIVAPVTLSAVAVTPTQSSVGTGASASFSASAVCSSTCPGTIVYVWSLNTALGSVSPASGSATTFTAGSSAGQVVLTVTATLGATERSANATISITSSSSSGGFLGLPGAEGYAVLAVVAVVIVGAVLFLLLSQRRKKVAPSGPPASGWGQAEPQPGVGKAAGAPSSGAPPADAGGRPPVSDGIAKGQAQE